MRSAWKHAFNYVDFFIFILIIFAKLAILESTVKLNGFNWFFIAVNAATILITSWWILFFRRKTRLVLFLSLDFSLSALIAADLVYYRYFQNFISVETVFQAKQLTVVHSSVSALVRPSDIFYFADALLGISLLPALFKRMDNFSPVRIDRLLTALLVLIGGVLVFNQAHMKTALRPTNSNILLYQMKGLLGYHGYDIYNYAFEYFSKPKLDDSYKVSISAWFSDHQKQINIASPYFGVAKNSNLIVVQAEALQSFVIGKKINGQEITPNLNKLLGESFYFENFYSQIVVGGTSDAEFLTNESLMPLYSGPVYTLYPHNDFDSLPKALKPLGYQSFAFHGFKKTYYNRSVFYPNVGFDKFYSIDDFPKDAERIGIGVSDSSFFRYAANQLEKTKPPYYAFLISLSSHNPFDWVPKEKQTLNAAPFEGSFFGNYLEAVHYFDQSLGQFIADLKQKGLWDRTVFALYGDHYSTVDISNKEYQKALGLADSASLFLAKDHGVPFFLRTPGQRRGQIISYPAGELDVAPTLLHLLGVSNHFYMMGDNLLPPNPDKMVYFASGQFVGKDLAYNALTKQCFSLSKNKQVDASACEIYGQRISDFSRMSQSLIKTDLIKEFRNGLLKK